METMPFPDVVVDVVGRDDRQLHVPSQLSQSTDARVILISEVVLQLDEHVVSAEDLHQPVGGEPGLLRLASLSTFGYFTLTAATQDDQALSMLGQPVELG